MASQNLSVPRGKVSPRNEQKEGKTEASYTRATNGPELSITDRQRARTGLETKPKHLENL
jgi:hypothetical protein